MYMMVVCCAQYGSSGLWVREKAIVKMNTLQIRILSLRPYHNFFTRNIQPLLRNTVAYPHSDHNLFFISEYNISLITPHLHHSDHNFRPRLHKPGTVKSIMLGCWFLDLWVSDPSSLWFLPLSSPLSTVLLSRPSFPSFLQLVFFPPCVSFPCISCPCPLLPSIIFSLRVDLLPSYRFTKHIL